MDRLLLHSVGMRADQAARYGVRSRDLGRSWRYTTLLAAIWGWLGLLLKGDGISQVMMILNYGHR